MSDNPVRSRVRVRGELLRDLTLHPAGPARIVLPQAEPVLVLRPGSDAIRTDLLRGDTRPLGSVLQGATTLPWAVRDGAGPTLVLRLWPEGPARLWPGELAAIRDRELPLGPQWSEAVAQVLAVANDPVAAADLADTLLVERAAPVDPERRALLRGVLRLSRAERGLIASVDLARSVGLPPDALFRLLDDLLGITPEELLAADRMRGAVRDLVPSGAGIGRVVRALRELGQLPPTELRRLTGVGPSEFGLLVRRADGLCAEGASTSG